jgi:prepilin-type N-terminal cleavage/methylation domain-containing protein
MTKHTGFTLIEATIAMAIVGLVAVATLSEFAAELRVSGTSVEVRVRQALVRDRISMMTLVNSDELRRVPDSLATGKFPRPFHDYQWSTRVEPNRHVDGLFEVTVTVRSSNGETSLTTRLFRPLPSVRRSRQ